MGKGERGMGAWGAPKQEGKRAGTQKLGTSTQATLPQPPRLAHLVEDLPHICLRLAKPHGQQLGALDADEVGLALVGNGLGQQRLAAACNKEGGRRQGGMRRSRLNMLLCGAMNRLPDTWLPGWLGPPSSARASGTLPQRMQRTTPAGVRRPPGGP